MNRPLSMLFVAVAAIGCGPAQQSADSPDGAPKAEQQRITNISYSDLAVCFPKPPALPEKLNREILVGLLVASRPQVMECLVDPRNRGGEKTTVVTLQSSVSAGGADTKVGGQNLTPDGEKCIRESIGRWFAAVPNLQGKVAAGEPPVTAEAQFQHTQGSSPSVQLGINEGSDIAGTVRLAQTSWCDCYAGWKDAAPRPLKSKIKLVKPAGAPEGAAQSVAPASVSFDPAGDPAADKAAACIQQKVSSMRFNATSDELTLPYTFLFVHSAHEEQIAAAPTDIQFIQLEAIRTQRSAAAAIAVGARINAAVIYDGLVKKYQANPDAVTVDELKAKCDALLKTDDGWAAAVERQLEMDEKTLALVRELKAKDPQWGRAEEAAQSTVDATKKDLETVKKTRTDDAGICPKERIEKVEKQPAKPPAKKP